MNKPTLIAAAIFAVLAIAFVTTRQKEVKADSRKLELAPVGSEALVEMVFGNVNLRSTAGTWTVGIGDKRYSADEGQVKAALQALAELKADDFVTDRPEKHAELEVDSAKGLVVTASTGAGVVRDLVLGKRSPDGGAYVRVAKSDAVFAVLGRLPEVARKDVSAWRKKAISVARPEDLERITFTPPSGAPWSLVLQSGTWRLEAQTPKDYRFDSDAAQQLVAKLCQLTAQDFTEARVEAPFTQVKVGLAEGKSKLLHLGAKQPDGTAALSIEGDAQTWVLAAPVVDALLKDPEALRDTRLLRFDPAQVERVSLVTRTKKTVVVKEGESWKLVEPKAPGFEFDAQQVSAQLNRLAALRAQKVVRDVVLLEPAVELELVTKVGVKRLQLAELTARGDDGLLYAVTPQDTSWLEAGPELFKRP